MLKRCALAAALLAGFAQTPAHAEFLGNAESEALTQQADVLMAKQKYQEAINTYQAAVKADPKASHPVSSLAYLLLILSDKSKGEQHDRLRGQSEALARQALKLIPQDPIAQETLRQLQDQPQVWHTPSREAQQALASGEVLFSGGKFTEALAAYERAIQLDPQASEAWVYAGDCYFREKNWPEAEKRFRKATEVEPLNSQAWRFLSDALIAQQKQLAAQEALFGAIAAQPSQLPNWEKLSQYRTMVGYPLRTLELKRKASARLDANKHVDIQIDASIDNDAQFSNRVVWIAYALGSVVPESSSAESGEGKISSPFMQEVNAWSKATQVVEKVIADGKSDSLDPALKQMQVFAKDKQLEHAVLVLLYKEAYRPELEAWKKADPDGIRKFINAYDLRP
jgi:tetratricopeptide (TPR) repeat protein